MWTGVGIRDEGDDAHRSHSRSNKVRVSELDTQKRLVHDRLMSCRSSSTKRASSQAHSHFQDARAR